MPYKREYGEPEEKAQSNFADPESRIMMTSSEGIQQCYNAQTAVEGENQLVVGAEVTDDASDQGQLIPMVDRAAAVCGETPEHVLADAGYGNEQDLRELEKQGIDGYVALAREGRVPAEVDPKEYPARGRMANKLATEEGRRRYARRKWQAEALVGWIKEVLGFRRFSFQGLENVRAEWTLVCWRSTSSGCPPSRRHEEAIVHPQYAGPRTSQALRDPNSRPCGPLSPSAAWIPHSRPPHLPTHPRPRHFSPSCHIHCASAAQTPSLHDGTDDPDNLQAAHAVCNLRKGAA